ncbi:MAG: hypothetical protein A3D28_03510 [Omnitrophica bacterium RIFCSPHIGHO2_02_FULL_63_14]|nr:MAG: hypothetical protein A3D28_03510 [Omnitrophica bacterium RIFCSPHIGHO2_02_FULL_63_14]
MFKERLAVSLNKLGLTANGATFIGLVLAYASGLLIYMGAFFLAGAALLLSGAMDLMDGAIARASGTVSKGGGILDSSLDRYGDFFVFGGLLFYFANTARPLYVLLSASALMGAYEISYVRARAECALDGCRVGYWERGERLVYTALALLIGNPAVMLWVLGVGTHVTALSRLRHALRKAAGRDGPSGRVWRRTGAGYLAATAALVAALFLFRVSP